MQAICVSSLHALNTVKRLMLIQTKLLEIAVQSKPAPLQIVYAVSFYNILLEQ
jgi:hypothetical protein